MGSKSRFPSVPLALRPIVVLVSVLAMLSAFLLGAAAPAQAEPTEPAPTSPTDPAILHPQGGQGGGDGLRVYWQNGQMQFRFEGSGQFYHGDWEPGSNRFFLAIPGTPGAEFTSFDAPTITNNGTRIVNTLVATVAGTNYYLDLVLDYVSPRQFVRLQSTLRPDAAVDPATLPEQVYFYWGSDTYLGGDDFGYGYYAERSGKPEVGTTNGTTDGLSIWARYNSGPAWSSYFSARYLEYIVAPRTGRQYTGIDTSLQDSGIGWNATVDPRQPVGTFDFLLGIVEGVMPLVAEEPSAPASVTVVPNGSTVDVSWPIPADDGGAPILGYSVTATSADGGIYSCEPSPPTATTCQFTDLPSGELTVAVSALNDIGAGPAVTTTVNVPPRPDAPAELTATPGDRSVALEFPAAVSQDPVTGYEYTTDGETTWRSLTTTGTNPVSATITAASDGAELVNGTSYLVGVRALNAIGRGGASEPVEVTPRTVPDAPSDLVATAGVQSAELTFNAPASDGGSPITGYEYSTDGSSWLAVATTGTGPLSATITSDSSGAPLQGGEAYNVQLRAVNEAGPSTDVSASVTPTAAPTPTVPDAPTALVASPGNGSALIGFTPGANGSAPITNYEYSTDGGTTWAALSPPAVSSPVSIPGLENFATYQVKLRAVNAVGTGAESAAVTVVPSPGLVFAWGSNLNSELGTGSSEESSNVPVAAASALTQAGESVIEVGTGSSSSCALTQSGKVYCWGSGFFGDGRGQSQSDVPIQAGTTGPMAGKYIVSIAMGLDTSCALSREGQLFCWGSGNNGQNGDGTNTQALTPVAVDQTGVLSGKTITQIAAGAFHVCALTSDGAAFCWGSNTFGQLGNGTSGFATAQNRPTAVNMSSGALLGKALVEVDAGIFSTCVADSDGNGYCWGRNNQGQLGDNTTTNRSNPTPIVFGGGLSGAKVASFGLGDTTSCAVLVGGSAACWGNNSSGQLGNGTFTSSLVPTAVTPVGTFRSIAAGYSFSCGVVDAGSPYCWGQGDYGELGAGFNGTSSTPVAVSTSGVMANAQVQQVEVSAYFAVAWAPEAPPAALPPSAPTGLVATAGNGSVSIAFDAPASDGGAAISNYEYSLDNGANWVGLSPADESSPVSIGGLTNGTVYSVQLRAVNVAGAGAPSAAISATPRTVPGVPTVSGWSPTNAAGEVSVELAAPGSDGGSVITDYEYSTDDGATWVSAGTVVSPLTVSGLTAGVDTAVLVRAVNAAGRGAASDEVFVRAGVPSAPRGVVVTAGDAAAVVAFVAPEFDGGSVVTDYEVRVQETGTGVWSNWTGFVPAVTSSPLPVMGLVNGVSYEVQVRAVNNAGSGVASVVAGPVTPTGPPDVPSGVSGVLTATPGEVLVSWTEPVVSGGVPVVSYEVSALDAAGGLAGSCVSGPVVAPAVAATQCVVAGLVLGESLTFVVSAMNAAGSVSDASVASAPVLVVGPAGVPTDVAATPTGLSGEVSVSFAAPVDAGGGTVSDYEYAVDGGAWVSAGTTSSPLTITGLTDGTGYQVALRAVNEFGAGASSPQVLVTPRSPAGAPVVTGVTAGDGQVSVGLTAPTSDGGSVVTNYEYTIDGGASWVAVSPASSASPVVITGLTNGTAYSVGVRAVNAAGRGAASALTSVTPFTSPGAPVVTSASPWRASAVVEFTAPSSTGGSPVTGYEYTVDGGGSWLAFDSPVVGSPVTIPGLVNGTAYEVGVRALNAAGAGVASNVVSPVVPFGVPNVPTGLVGVAGPGAGQVTVSWTPLADAPNALRNNNGREVSSYTAGVRLGSRQVGSCVATGQSATSCVVSGLTPGVSYEVIARARNVAGWSGLSTAPTPVAPFGTPGAPAIMTLNPTDTSFAVSFLASDPRGAAVTNYQYSTDGGTTWRAFAPPVTGTGTAAGIVTRTSGSPATSLVPGTTYQVRLRGINAHGVGTASPSSSVSLPKVPGAPTITSAEPTGTSGQVSVVFTAPTFTGVPALTNYQYSTDDGATWTNAATTTSPLLITGLVDGTAYQVKLRAVNPRGAGAVSNTASGTPRTAPGAPTGLAAAPTNVSRQLEVTFDAPASDGGSPITDYQYRLDGGDWTSGATSTSPILITDLTDGVEYAVEVRAVNAAAPGPAAGPVNATPRTTPAAPGNLAAAPNDISGELSVTFTPGDDGGSAITGYEYRLDGGGWLPGSDSPLTLTGLTNGTEYDVEVRAVNAAGEGTPAGPVSATPRTTPGAPGALSATHGNARATLSFTAPSDDGGAAITGYEYTTDSGTTWAVLATTGAGPLSAAITVDSAGAALVNGTEYSVGVRAVNIAGGGTPATTTVTPSTTPSAPAAPTNTPGDGQIVVAWTAPGNGGATITRYQAFATDSDGFPAGSCTIDGTPADTTCTITGLDNGTTYTTTVRARNLNGQSPSSPQSTPTTPQPTP